MVVVSDESPDAVMVVCWVAYWVCPMAVQMADLSDASMVACLAVSSADEMVCIAVGVSDASPADEMVAC